MVSEVAQVPGGDLFGTSEITDVGDPGSHGFSITLDGAFAKRGGRYVSLAQKYAYERVIAENWAMSFALFSGLHHVRAVPGLLNRSAFQFDGASFEVAHRLIERSASNPFAFKIALEPRWGRLDDAGRRSESFGAELKLITDAVLIPGRLYWGMNVILGSGTSRDPDLRTYSPSSEIKVTKALALHLAPNLLVGAEATYIATFDGAAFNVLTGQALFAGPTIFWKVTEKVSLNAVIAPQIAGRAVGSAFRRTDLDNFTRLTSRVKLAVEF